MMVKYLHYVKDFLKIGAIFGHQKSDEKTIAKLAKRSKRNYAEIEKFIEHGKRKRNAKKQ